MEHAHLKSYWRLRCGTALLALVVVACLASPGMAGKETGENGSSLLEDTGNQTVSQGFRGLPFELYREVLKYLPFDALRELRRVNRFCRTNTFRICAVGQSPDLEALKTDLRNASLLTLLSFRYGSPCSLIQEIVGWAQGPSKLFHLVGVYADKVGFEGFDKGHFCSH
ncbi:MAG: hypothetical protein ACRC4G_01655, partial [Alphaproteobacteria bacterium]